MAALMRSRHLADLGTIARCRLVCREWAEWAEDGVVGALVGWLADGRLALCRPPYQMVAWLERRVDPGQLDGLVGRKLVRLGSTGIVRAGTSWPPSGAVGAALVAAAAVNGATLLFREAAAALPERDRDAYVNVAAFAWRHYRDDALAHLVSLGYPVHRPRETSPDDECDWFRGHPCPVCQRPTIFKTLGSLSAAWPANARSERPQGRWRGTVLDHLCWGQHDDQVDGEHMCPRCRIGFYVCEACHQPCRFIGGDGAWLARSTGWTVDPRDVGKLPEHYVGDLGVEFMTVPDGDGDRGTSVVYACDGCHQQVVLTTEPPAPYLLAWEKEMMRTGDF
jgi:hypothetical protein